MKIILMWHTSCTCNEFHISFFSNFVHSDQTNRLYHIAEENKQTIFIVIFDVKRYDC